MQIARAAADKGLRCIAFTDHYLTRKTKSLQPYQLNAYLDEIETVRTRWKDRLKVLTALEIDLLDLELTGRCLPGDEFLSKLDFLLFEYVSDIPLAGIPLAHLLSLLQDIPCPAGLAHTDLPIMFPHRSADELLEIFRQHRIFIELNEAYHRPGDALPFYRHAGDLFLKTRNRSVYFSAGTDLHNRLDLLGAREAVAFLEKLDLKSRILPVAQWTDPDVQQEKYNYRQTGSR